MKKKLAVILIVLLAAFAFATVAFADNVWTGDPDPYACNIYMDCSWTIDVCIHGVTYEVGIYYDPATKTDEFMEKDALSWSGTELTIGVCPYAHGNMVIPDMYALVNPDYEAPEGVIGVSQYDVCFIISDNGAPSVERQIANCDYKWPGGSRPGWTEGASFLTHGPVYYDGTDWGWWTGDTRVSNFTYSGNVPRLPLYGNPGLFSVWCEYTQQWTEELPGFCKP